MTEQELIDWKNQVDLECAKEVHDLHNDYPLAPELTKINIKSRKTYSES